MPSAETMTHTVLCFSCCSQKSGSHRQQHFPLNIRKLRKRRRKGAGTRRGKREGERERGRRRDREREGRKAGGGGR